MALAEPRKRRKNPMHSINLSAQNHWTNDDSKFGQRMLEKFGWSKGSGLGKNKQGISENIRVEHKVQPTGLGFIAHNADDWFKAGEDYSRLLSQLTEKYDQYQALSESDNDKTTQKSLVLNSLNSRSRVHYHKFTKGKDLTQYKREELTCILGKGLKDDGQCLNGLNMKEYFKAKKISKKLQIDKHDTSSVEDSMIINNDNMDNKVIIKEEKSKNNFEDYKSKKLQIDECETTTSVVDCMIINNQNMYESITFKEEPKIETVEHEINTIMPEIKKRRAKQLKDTELVLSNEENTQLKKKKKKIKELQCENIDHVELSKKKKINKKLPINKDVDVEKYTSGSNNKYDDKTFELIDKESSVENDKKILEENDAEEQESELVLKKKYQNLVDLLIENSSAGTKYCKDSTTSLFQKQMKEFADNVKHQYSTTGSTELKSSDKEIISHKPIALDPNDKHFIKDFEEQKFKALEIISKRQQLAKYVNDKSMFIAKHGDVLFFGSNINDIKGYGEW